MSDSANGNDPRLFEMIAHEAIMGVMAFDSASRECVYVNRLARESLELGSIGSTLKLSDLFPAETRSPSLRALSETMVANEGFSQNVQIQKHNGLYIIADISIRHMALTDGRVRILLMFQDITIQKKLQREIELKEDEIKNAMNQVLEQNRQLLALDSAKDRFIALTTHELRTPLSAVVATAEVLQLKLYEDETQRDEFIQTIYEQGLHLMELVNDILDFAKIRAGKMEFYVEQMDALPLVTKLADSFQQMASQAQVDISIVKPATEMKIYADSLRLREVLSNVINNAIKYNRVSGKVSVEFELLNHAPLMRIRVIDTGIGIAADKLHHVFNEFETVGHVSRHHKGTGLGMPISKRLMQGMGGDLTLESVEGQGTVFWIDIPIEKVLPEEVYRSRVDSWSDLAA